MARDQGSRVLPLGFNETMFDQVVDEMISVVGSEHVSRDSSAGNIKGPNGETAYGDYWAMPNGSDTMPSGAVRPASVGEVQSVLALANRHKLPLWTVSRGRNFGYGGSGAVVRGTMILDLQRMNKIIEVDEELAYAIVEPGVSFFDLYHHIQERGYRLWPSVPALGWGSIVGNTLERGFGYTPEGEHSQQQCGMEVVLASGKYGFGPSIDGLFFQSNLGIVTKLGIHITPSPVCMIDCKVSVPDEDQLAILISTCAALEREGIIQNHASIANPYRQILFSSDKDLQMRALHPGMQGKAVPNRDLAALARQKGFGYWMAQFAVYGASSEVAEANWNVVQDRFRNVAGARAEGKHFANADGTRLDASKLPTLEIPFSGYPTVAAAEALHVRGHGGGHVDISPLFPANGAKLQEWWLTEARDIVFDNGFDTFADFHVYGRYVIGILLIVYAPQEAERAATMVEQLLASTKRAGVSEYRAHLNYMDEVRDDYNFNNGALKKLVERLKEVLDPVGILSQGKQGIWSQRKV